MRGLTPPLVAALLVALMAACGQLPVAPKRPVPFTILLTDRDGAAVAGARVQMSDTRDRYARSSGRTEADGRAHFQIAPGSYDVDFESPDGAGLPSYLLDVPVTVASGGGGYHFAYGGYLVSGTITGPDGSVVDSGSVSFTNLNDEPFGYTSQDFHGGISRVWLAAGNYRLFALSRPWPSHFPRVSISSVAVARDTTINLTMSGHKISGRVLGPDGSPQPNVDIVADGDGDAVSITVSDASGDYYQYLPSGNYRWTLYPEAPYRYILPRDYPLAAVTGPATIDFDLTGTSWTGTIRDIGSGAPLPGLAVRAQLIDAYSREARCLTDAAGGFRLELESGKDYDIDVGLELYRPFATFRMPRAGADSTFDLLVDPSSSSAARIREVSPTRSVTEDYGLRAGVMRNNVRGPDLGLRHPLGRR